MRVETLTHSLAGGWSGQPFPPIDSEQTLMTVFGAPARVHDPAAIHELLRAYPRATVIGCSTAGEIAGSSILDDNLSVAVCRFERTRLRSAFARVGADGGSRAAGAEIGDALLAPDLRAVLVISDGIGVNGSELLRGLNDRLPVAVVVTGGLAGDGDRFQRTWILADGGPTAGGVSAVGFYGDHLVVRHGSRGGWDTFGPERVITRSVGNVLYEIDGRPALALYKEYLGERANELPAAALLFPLALRRRRGDDASLVRTILSIDEQAQSMTFAGDVPEGNLARLMRANFDRLIGGASEAARVTAQGDHLSGPSLAIAISCVGRRLVLGQRAEEEVEAAREGLPAGTELVGFYSYGEISPYASGRCDLHNQTMTLTHFEES